MKKKPIKMFRTCDNPRSTDWNDEPEKVEVSYVVWEMRANRAFVNRAGWHGMKYRHWVDRRSLHITKDLGKPVEERNR